MLVMVPNGGTTARGRSSSEVANRSWSWILPGRTENPTRIRCRSKGVSVATSRAPRAMRVRAAAGVRSFLKSNPAIRIVTAGRLVGETAEIPERSRFLCAGILEPRVRTWFRLVLLVLLGLLGPLNQRSEESGVLGQLSDSSSSAVASVRGQRSGKISARTSMNRASATVERRIVRRVMGPGASVGVQVSVCFQATGRGPLAGLLAGLLAGRLSGSQGRSAEESPAVGGNQVVRFPRARFSSISSSE